jgi:hypothetical protein
MANALFDKGREGFLDGSINWATDNIKAALLSAGYTPNLATHQFVSDLGANIISRSGNLAGKTVAAGIADAGDIVFSAVTGAQVTQMAIYKDTGNDATSRLIALIDTATGLPVTPNGGDINVAWSEGVNKIFKL